ncbi:twin-arginine translocation protein, TatA/E family subunit [Weeksella sp. HMSC059D05]|uniref:Sec-independent protein translocase protein TatA n=2 Tax=Weeksellaceae TaxID=2762318 RepID=F0P0M2_WEEVC|nr:twin-arginine translocation protein, TatA/E family subunit [Weeksella virosa DSM 16922]OFM84474.1 twin-arginine translocation protein, TatA/E family subunit [Weeksella sp. HMSC059D05]SUP54855.1 Sec-independent protein translocase protein TatAy [Weeksella virosa]VEH63822.1 Sec-independent protein translocase protein TatAy [Weeksella virosa]
MILIGFIGFQEIVVILLVSIIIFGPKKIPEIARGLGEGVRQLKNATENIKEEIMKPVEDLDPTKEIRETIDEAKKEIDTTVDEALGGSVKR